MTTQVIPIRRILTEDDLDKFDKSETKSKILGFVKDLNSSILGKTNDTECGVSAVVEAVIENLVKVSQQVDEYPASDIKSTRFGKPEFRDFYDAVQKKIPVWVESLPDFPNKYIPEVGMYLSESFGNRQRIDYGSGHELNFMSFLLCLKELGLVKPEDYPAVVLRCFTKYLETMRKIQTMYWLEPAGSHGVWGLDDYHFLPFLFGSGQLVTHKHLRPISIHDNDLIELYHKKYIYFDAIRFINSVKTASLRWHSPLLDDISGVKTWAKVNEGMIKMYDKEVLSKLPIMQHYLFGSLIPAPEGISPPPPEGSELPHVHNTWADCCGIKVPSAIAAKVGAGGELRIPFD